MRRFAVKQLAAALSFVALVGATHPNSPYRSIQFEAPPHAKAQGQIEVLGGWAAIKRDLSGAAICLSFRNDAAETATKVVFGLHIVGGSGGTLKEIDLDRRGSFPTGVVIPTWKSLSYWRNGVGSTPDFSAAEYNANCKFLKGTAATFALISAHAVTYRVTRIEYANGHVLTL